MFKSIFLKYFFMTLSIILVCFIVLGFTFAAYTTSYLTNEKRELLYYNVNRLANLTPVYSVTTPDGIAFTKPYTALLVTTSNALSADVFIAEKNGKTVTCSEGESCIHTHSNIAPDIMDKVFDNTTNTYYYEVGNLNTLYSKDYYTVAMPLRTTSGDILGAVFISSPADNLNRSTRTLIQTFIISSVCIIMLSLVIIYWMTYRMVKPLTVMSKAAKNFGDGDFSIRVPVTGKDEVSDLCASFNNMASSLSSSEDMRRNFIANVSHELKTPMTSIAGFIDGILDGTIPPDKHSYYLRIVSDEVKRLSRLVRTMLDLSRIEAGEVRYNPINFNVSETIFRSFLSFETIIEQKNITIKGLNGLLENYIYADPDLIHQIIYNLVDNAVKFTNSEGFIEVNVTDTPTNTSIVIGNSGIGINSEDLRHIFERFYKTDKSRSLDKKGVGLGLFICKMFVNMHGGDIYAKSEEGSYCEFGFNIPKVNIISKEKKDRKYI